MTSVVGDVEIGLRFTEGRTCGCATQTVRLMVVPSFPVRSSILVLDHLIDTLSSLGADATGARPGAEGIEVGHNILRHVIFCSVM